MILSYEKPFNKKLREQLAKIWKKKTNLRAIFLTLPIDDMKTKENRNLFCWYENTPQ